jgi:hypothetical protein
VLSEFASLAGVHRGNGSGLLKLSLRFAVAPLSPLDRRHVGPDRELAALVAERSSADQDAPAARA